MFVGGSTAQATVNREAAMNDCPEGYELFSDVNAHLLESMQFESVILTNGAEVSCYDLVTRTEHAYGALVFGTGIAYIKRSTDP